MYSHYKMTVSQTPAAALSGARTQYKPTLSRRFMTTEEFWNSRAYFPTVLIAAALFLFTGQDLLGMLVCAAAATYIQFTCRDIMAAVLPEVLFLLLGTRYYDNLGSLLSIWWILPPFAASFVYNFVHWRIRLRVSACRESLMAVSIAALIGGIGVISVKDYFSLNGLMYGVGLGAGMLLAGALYGTNLTRPRSYDLCSRFAGILYSIGIFTGLVVVNYYITHMSEIVPDSGILYLHFRNYLTTMMVLALPMPFKFLKNNRLHIISIAFMYLTLLLAGSRSGLVFGTLILFACIFHTVTRGASRPKRSAVLLAVFAVAAAIVIFALAQTVLNSRLVDGKLFPVTDSRIMFLKQSVLDFLSSPLNGIGLANMQNSKIFVGVDGSMVWYHNYFAQILGSMGLVGIFAYGWLLRDRFRYLRELHMSGETMLAISYIGILLVSMTNPGEFCPLPNEFLVVVLFEVAETVRSARAEATVSGETSCVTWVPSRRRVKLGEYNGLSSTVSLSAGTKPLVLKPEYADKPSSPSGKASLFRRDQNEAKS